MIVNIQVLTGEEKIWEDWSMIEIEINIRKGDKNRKKSWHLKNF